MRQLDPVTNLVLSALASLGLLATLSFPWFAAPAASTNPTDGPVERGAWQVGHFFSHDVKGRVSGDDAVGGGGSVLIVVAAVIIGLALAVGVPAVRRQAEDMLRVAGFAAPVAVIFLAVSHSGTTGAVRIHYGVAISFAVAVFVASCAYHGATLRQRQNRSPHAVRVSR